MRKFHKIIAEIKSLSEQQGSLKAQRKTVHLKVERTMPAFKASYLAANNSNKLKHLFIAYALLKGKEPIYPSKSSWDKSLVDNFVERYQAEKVE